MNVKLQEYLENEIMPKNVKSISRYIQDNDINSRFKQ